MKKTIFTLRKTDSKSELMESLNSSNTNSLLLGEDIETPDEFVELSIKDIQHHKEVLKIGIICEHSSINPQCDINNKREVILGFNKKLSVINLNTCSEAKQIELDSIFYEFKIINNCNLIIICETDIYCLNENYEIIWTKGLDLIINYDITDQYIKVETEEKMLMFSLFSGLAE